jgi:exo-1,4-beta-D-glucosaminidase
MHRGSQWFAALVALIALGVDKVGAVEQREGGNMPEIGDRILLRDGWQLQSTVLAPEGGQAVSTQGFSTQGWFPVQVPTTVLRALIKAGVYPDMRIGLNNFRIPDASDDFNRGHDLAKYSHLPDHRNPWKDPYWYRKEFALPRLAAGQQAWLQFDALNYRADVWLNGRQVAERQNMAGMFQRFVLNITAEAKTGKNTLAVRAYPVDHPGMPSTQFEILGRDRNYQTDLMKDVTMVTCIGYDCMPTVRDRHLGLWQPVSVFLTGPVDIRHPFVVTHLPLPKTDRAELTISAELANATALPQRGVLRGRIVETGQTFEQAVSLAPHETRTVVFAPKPVIQAPKLWWPNNYGAQSLYRLALSFDADGRLSDWEQVTFGVREVTRTLHERDGWHGTQVLVNGQKVFCRGGYIQPEILFDWDARRMEAEIRYYARANLNLVYFEDIPNPPDDFLALCDRYGIMFGNCFYSCFWARPGTDHPQDVDLLSRCTVDILKRYRNHPSLVLYMAMNEEVTREPVYTMWRRHVNELDGTRFFIPSAYFPEDRKDVPPWIKPDLPTGMTDIGASYGWLEPAEYFRRVRDDRRWMFMMESGSASLPPIESLRKFIPDLEQAKPGPQFPLTKTWAEHGANHYYRPYDEALRRLLGPPESVADYCRKGQLVTADQHRAMFEAVNHKMWDITGGFTQWKINACWPSVQWQIFDWYLKPMVSYYYIKRACEPLHVQLDLPDQTVTVINNRLDPAQGLNVLARLYDFDMHPLLQQEAKADIGANSFRNVFALNKVDKRTPIYFVKLELRDADGRTVSGNFYWFSSRQPADLRDLQRLPIVRLDTSHRVERRGDETAVHVRLRNTTTNLAFFIHLAVKRGPGGEEILPVLWDDNYFSLLPGESREVSSRFAAADAAGAEPAVQVDGWNIASPLGQSR